MHDKKGTTALMLAAQYGHFECVKVLAPLEKGAKSVSGYTALNYTIPGLSAWECARFLWQFPEERETDDLKFIRKMYHITRVSCEGGTCIGAGSLLNAAFLGCPQCV